MPAELPSEISAIAIIYSGKGGYEVVGVGRRAVRQPGPDEVLIKVAAAAINPTDILLRDPGLGDVPLPMTPGMDVAGVVEMAGSEVTQLAVGDAVMAAVSPMRPEGGAQASYIVIPAASAVRKPHSCSLTEAATLPMNGLTALFALDHAGLVKGQMLGVSGGAGWLAYLAITVARHRGLRVIADAKRDEVELVRGYGADIVVERSDDFAGAMRRAVPEGVDALLDTAVLGALSFPAIRDGGVYIPVRGWSGPDADRGVQIKPVLVNEVLGRTEWLETIRHLAEKGDVTPRVASEHAPGEIVDAQRQLLAGGIRGRPVIVFTADRG